jgi:hypothetical protein
MATDTAQQASAEGRATGFFCSTRCVCIACLESLRPGLSGRCAWLLGRSTCARARPALLQPPLACPRLPLSCDPYTAAGAAATDVAPRRVGIHLLASYARPCAIRFPLLRTQRMVGSPPPYRVTRPTLPSLRTTPRTFSGTYFSDKESLAEHYRSDFHRYNLKRKVAGLPPVTKVRAQAGAASRGPRAAVRKAPGFHGLTALARGRALAARRGAQPRA